VHCPITQFKQPVGAVSNRENITPRQSLAKSTVGAVSNRENITPRQSLAKSTVGAVSNRELAEQCADNSRQDAAPTGVCMTQETDWQSTSLKKTRHLYRDAVLSSNIYSNSTYFLPK
jgi:hypothetical protein